MNICQWCWYPNLSSLEQGLGSRLLSWVSGMGICAHSAAVCNHIAGWFSWKKSLAWKFKMVKFWNAFQPQKIRANTFREWQARSCQNASQRGRMQERLEHSGPPDVNLDQIQITAMPAARFSWVPGKIQFSIKWGCHLNTIKATLKHRQKGLSLLWMPSTSPQ